MTYRQLVFGLLTGLVSVACGKKDRPTGEVTAVVKQQVPPAEPPEAGEASEDDLTEEDDGHDMGIDEGENTQ
jgi:hypothetical protein